MAATVKSSKKRVRALSSSAKATLRLLTSGWRIVVMYNTQSRGSDSYYLVRDEVRKGRKPRTITRPVNYQTFRLFNKRGLVVQKGAMKNTRGKIIGREFIAG